MKRGFGILGMGLVGVSLVFGGAAAVFATQQEPREESSPVADHMQGVMKELRAIAGAVASPDGSERALEELANLESILLQVKLETPSRAAGLEGEELATFMKGFRLKIIEFLGAVLEIEQMVLNDEPVEETLAKLKDLQDIKKEGHRAYK